MQRLFVYGTLAPGRVNHDVLEDIPGSWEEATLRGKLFQKGWGAGLGYPGIVVRDDGDEVEGFVFCSTELSDHWSRLDAFEGNGYRRVSVTVNLKDNKAVEAYVYVLNCD